MISFLIISILSVSATWAQAEAKQDHSPKAVSDTGIYRAVNTKAEFPSDWQKYLKESLKFPKQFREDSVAIRVIIEFIIEKDGSLSRPRALRSEGHINGVQVAAEQLKPFAEEAIRVILMAPKWQPALNNGITVRSYFTLPIKFRTD
ncbi:MAG: hypothetical protein BGO31_07690 [Bacteroidetes bacterium 43-16]|nr:MAG: hypothetical protein BGO31_07690 [Bacteroidetes bacterium 43-16]